MLTSHHIYAVKNIMSKGAVSDDFQYSNTLILHFLNTTRALLLKDKMKAYETISSSSYQTACLELEAGNFHNCCGINLPSHCTILKSKFPLPNIITYRSSSSLRVLTIGGDQIPKSTVLRKKYDEFSLTKPKRGYFIHNNYLYIINDPNIKLVLVEGIFAFPEEEELFCKKAPDPDNINGSACKTILDATFPIDADLVLKMYDLTIKFLLQTDAATRDTGNDSHSTDNRGERQA